MKKINVLFIIFALFLVFGLNANAKVYVGNVSEDSVYTLSDTKYDQETGEVTYQKVTYSKNTYWASLLTSTLLPAASLSVQFVVVYVFLLYATFW